MRARVPRVLLLVLAFSAPGLWACRVGCDFEPHCEGNVVMECSVGVDQLVGSGSPVVYPCLEPAPLCVERRTLVNSPDGARFYCARSPLTPCDETFVASCEGTVRVSCVGGYVSAEDCTHQPGTGRCGRHRPDGPVQCL
jgi:hypothetical protein